MIRFLLWRVLGVFAVACAVVVGTSAIAWLARGGLGASLRGSGHSHALKGGALSLAAALGSQVRGVVEWRAAGAVAIAPALLIGAVLACVGAACSRVVSRRRRRYVRLRVAPYRGDRASAEAIVAMYDALHKRLLRRWWRRLLLGQPTISLEIHYAPGPEPEGRSAWLAVVCPAGTEAMVESGLRHAYPNCRLDPARAPSEENALVVCERRAAVLRLKKSASFIERVKSLDRFEHEREPAMNRLLTTIAATGSAALVQLALTPAPAFLERVARRLHERRELHFRDRDPVRVHARGRSMVREVELRGGLDVQHRPLFFADLRIVAPDRRTCEAISSELRVASAENRLVERGTAIRHSALNSYRRRIARGEGNPLPSFRRNVFASTELAAMWQLPASDFAAVPFSRAVLPVAPAPPGVSRPSGEPGTLVDAIGPVSIRVAMRRQHTAAPGTVEQGKSSFLVATVAEDLRRANCAVIVLDPKGDAADAALSAVPDERTCTLLDFAHPTCGFNPLAVDAPADVIADYVVGALKHLFTDADIRASSDRYLRNAVIAVLAHDRRSTLWDAARLLSVGEEGYAYRRAVGARVRTLPELKEIALFFTGELSAQLADARSTTTSKLDAPVNKLARLLNSASIKRVLLNESLRVDFEQIISRREVLVVRGALGVMGAGNTSVLMQLLVGMLDAALARQQDLVPAPERVSVALKIDEAPLVLNRGFAETMALKRSAGLETVACWQSDAQWIDRDVRDQLDALFAHRVYFATASVRDARAAAALTMAEFSDTIRPNTQHLSALGHPDVRLHLPRHTVIASWVTEEGRQPPFVAHTVPLRVDKPRLELHAARQHERGARFLADLRQPHWASREGVELGHADDGRTARDDRAGWPAPAHVLPTPAPVLPRVRSARAAASNTRVLGSLPERAADSYRELVELDVAQSVRLGPRVRTPRALEPDALDLEVLALIAGLRHVLTSQLHRHFNSGRAVTTTQRRLKRLSDARLVDRFQFHRRDGGGVPMCYAITPAGRQLLGDRAAAPAPDAGERSGAAEARRDLTGARRDVHAAGWALALVARIGRSSSAIRGADACALSPSATAGESGAVLAPGDLRLPEGRAPHDFLTTNASGKRVEVERFETIRPHVIVEVAHGERTLDVIAAFDDRLADAAGARKLERYEHFLAGWSLHTRRYGARSEVTPIVAFVCRDRARARRCAECADAVLRACRAYAGEYPFDWEYPGRDRVRFVAERDVHEGLLGAYRVPQLPPDVRVSAAGEDPRAARASGLACSLLDLDSDAAARGRSQ
ncbi:MAG TPA: replication-relaxation family protein [Solirubrobacteraceae bacterium]|nr:replication-relaxation family protein [Solirubrobacteraceae bacterium]